MNISQIEANVQHILKHFKRDKFIYDLLLAYGIPKASVTRLQQGNLNLSKIPGEIAWKKKLFFKEVDGEDLHQLVDSIRSSERALKHDPRFLIVTDYESLLAVDRKTSDTLDVPIMDIAKHFDFFLPWVGMEKAQHQSENPADVKAAEKMAKLYDEIKKDNPTTTPEAIHNLNIFLSRLLFCFFAEDTEIFPQKGMFTNAISSYTQPDGSDLNTYLDNLFEILNTEKIGRSSSLPAFYNAFPYVNGGLFRNRCHAPVFSHRSRQLLIECGSLQWKDIHPDIFGSMIQAVISPEDRGGWGMHYTSVPNIMKVIEPLFLNDLYEEFEAAKNEPKKLNKLQEGLSRIKIFDPACGSGNFLIIAYKELRLLEIKILQRLQELRKIATGFEPKQLELIPKQQLTFAASYQLTLFSRVELSQFYGIELDDFAYEVAILSLWLAQHQMNMKFKEIFGAANPTLPLQAGGNIVQGNATRLEWESVCPKEEGWEIFILGNPPYLGSFLQNKKQKEDLAFVCKGFKSYKDLDYIACWFIKAAIFIESGDSKFAFVTTNSIIQVEQLILLWPYILSKNLEIFFAYKSFKWVNNAKNNAGVYCTIIGVRHVSSGKKKIFGEKLFHIVNNINPYLTNGSSIIISKRMKPLAKLPTMNYGSKIVDDGYLIFSREEKLELTQKYPSTGKLFKRLSGSAEFIKGLERWCLYIADDELDFANSIPEIAKRLKLVASFRSKSSEVSTREMAALPHKFYYSVHNNSNSIIIPRTSSERRSYIPLGFLNGETIVSDAASVIFGSEPWIFAILTSRIHMTWVRAVAGRLKTDYRYSSQLCYNTFPFPEINDQQRNELEGNVYTVLSEREKYSEKNLAELYDPEKMPAGLKQAHNNLDLSVERCYRSKPFETDEERLEYLFKLYEQMIAEEKARIGELKFEQTKTKKKKNTYA